MESLMLGLVSVDVDVVLACLFWEVAIWEIEEDLVFVKTTTEGSDSTVV